MLTMADYKKGAKVPNVSARTGDDVGVNFWSHNVGTPESPCVVGASDCSYNASTTAGKPDIRHLFADSTLWLVREGEPGYDPSKGGDAQLILTPRPLVGGRRVHDVASLADPDVREVLGSVTIGTTSMTGELLVGDGELVKVRIVMANNVSRGSPQRQSLFVLYLPRPASAQPKTPNYNTGSTPPTNNSDDANAADANSDDIPF